MELLGSCRNCASFFLKSGSLSWSKSMTELRRSSSSLCSGFFGSSCQLTDTFLLDITVDNTQGKHIPIQSGRAHPQPLAALQSRPFLHPRMWAVE